MDPNRPSADYAMKIAPRRGESFADAYHKEVPLQAIPDDMMPGYMIPSTMRLLSDEQLERILRHKRREEEFQKSLDLPPEKVKAYTYGPNDFGILDFKTEPMPNLGQGLSPVFVRESDDPLGQMGYVGWKASFQAAPIIDPKRLENVANSALGGIIAGQMGTSARKYEESTRPAEEQKFYTMSLIKKLLPHISLFGDKGQSGPNPIIVRLDN